MTAACHPFPADAAQGFLAFATRALCDHPGETRPDAEARTRQMVHTALGFEPRDGLEFMLSSLIYGQVVVLLDAMHDVFHAEPGPQKHRARTGVATLNRALLSTLREFRLQKTRPAAPNASAPQAETATQTNPAPATPPTATPPPGPRPEAEAKPPPHPPARPVQPQPQSPGPTRPMPEHPLVKSANIPPEQDPDDGIRLAANFAAFQKAHADARKTLAEAVPRAHN